MKKMVVPKFATEREEAEWWDAHMDVVEDNLFEAIGSGTAKTITPQLLAERILKANTSKKPAGRKAS